MNRELINLLFDAMATNATVLQQLTDLLENEINNSSTSKPVKTKTVTSEPVASEPVASEPVTVVTSEPMIDVTFDFSIPTTSEPMAPFNDNKGLLEYVMKRYKELGPAKGGELQQIIIGMGTNNVNHIKPEQYAEFYAKCEAVK